MNDADIKQRCVAGVYAGFADDLEVGVVAIGAGVEPIKFLDVGRFSRLAIDRP